MCIRDRVHTFRDIAIWTFCKFGLKCLFRPPKSCFWRVLIPKHYFLSSRPQKEAAIISDKLWKDAGRPRSGQLFSRRSSDKRAYKSAIRKQESDSVERYSNELNNALLSKRGNDFWKCWNAKFSSGVGQCKQVDGLTDHQPVSYTHLTLPTNREV